MTIIFKIAKTELRNLFYSPVAWFLAIVFLIQCAIFYTEMLTPIATWQDLLLKNNPKFKNFDVSLTEGVFLALDGIFSNALRNLYLFIPLLTMGLLSREVNSGSIKLLYSSPIKLREIVLGKYLAVMIYNGFLLLILGIFMVSGGFNIRSVDYGLLLSAALGFYLLLCTYSAIGLFMSSLTTYQIVSAIGSFVIIFVLSRIGTLWQKYDVVRDIIYFLSIGGRTEKMLRGLITTKDLLYFILVIYMFLSFTLFKLKGGRESKPWYTKSVRYFVVIFSALFIGYVSSRPGLIGYWDTTALQSNTLHPRTQKIIKQLDDNYPLEITLYTNLLGSGVERGLPEARNQYLATLWEPFLRFSPNIKFKYVYYYDNDGSLDNRALYRNYPRKTEKQIAEIIAEGLETDISLFIPPAEIRKVINSNDENNRIFVQVKYKGQSINLRTFNDPTFWPDEAQIATALKRLVESKPPKIYFLTGNLERSIIKTGEREYSLLSLAKQNRYSLLNRSFNADTLNLENQEIPADITALVIADPKTIIGTNTFNKVQRFIDDGGNLFLTGEPGKQNILNPLLKNLGVQLRPGTLVQLSKNEVPNMVIPQLTPAVVNLAEEQTLLNYKKSLESKNTDDTLKIVMPGATGISYASNGPFTITPLVRTISNKTWLKSGALVLDSVPPVFKPQDGDIKESSFPTIIQLTRQIKNKQQRIIVSGDADFTSNLRYGNNLFANAFYSWLNYGQYPIYLPRLHVPKDTLLIINASTAKLLKVVYVWVLPVLFLLLGSILLIRRKRK